jgi:hypothetical protein
LFTNKLDLFYTASSETLWITFSDRKLYWGFAEGAVYLDEESNKSKKIKMDGNVKMQMALI